jgi:uncharacterized membrane protein
MTALDGTVRSPGRMPDDPVAPVAGPQPPDDPGRPVRPVRRRVPRPAEYGLSGIVVGLVFVWWSLSPSLLPRGPVLQGVVSGIVGAVGYGLGAGLGELARRLVRRDPSRAVMRSAWRVVAVVGPAGTAVAVAAGARFQLRLHRLLDVPAPPPWAYLGTIVIAVVLAATLIQLARMVRWLSRRTTDRLDRYLTRGLAQALSVVLVAALVIGLLDGIVARGFFTAADGLAAAVDEALPEDLEPPSLAARSGGPGSLVAWGDLGAKGRLFVTGGPTTDELVATTRRPVADPIRVYVGLASAATDRDRADLAVAELERTGAFERRVLVVAIPTGTGHVNPKPVDALEYLHAGDTAVVATQYSYLPSWLSYLVDSGRARDAGRALFDRVHARWEELPVTTRPRLVVLGESLGSHGAEAAFSSAADLRNRTDGALFVGPPNFNPLWREFVRNRDPGSPERLPVYDHGRTVRFAARTGHLAQPPRPWPHPRVVYLQQASDPVVWWTPRVIVRRPDWLREPRGDDVLGDVHWFPVVTFVQLTVDLLNGYTIDTDGYGHRYGDVIVDAWLAVAPPRRWETADRERIDAALDWHTLDLTATGPDQPG